MKSNKGYLAIAALLLTWSICTPASAQTKNTQVDHSERGGASISIPMDHVKFAPWGANTIQSLGDYKAKGLQIQTGNVYGDPKVGPHGTFLILPAGFVSDLHSHTNDYFGVLIRGTATNHGANAEDVPMPPGSYWFQRGKEAHITKCLSTEDCLIFMYQDGKMDTQVLEKAK